MKNNSILTRKTRQKTAEKRERRAVGNIWARYRHPSAYGWGIRRDRPFPSALVMGPRYFGNLMGRSGARFRSIRLYCKAVLHIRNFLNAHWPGKFDSSPRKEARAIGAQAAAWLLRLGVRKRRARGDLNVVSVFSPEAAYVGITPARARGRILNTRHIPPRGLGARMP
ncbi:hypothetical protein B0H13DRAFT_1924200 [Mycena leptocephala]|nr:hypothetical protein B0H13DRAFT_1924200 [Mycena leptocephala]